MKEIRPTYGEGGWSSGHRFFRKAAYRARHDFQKSYTRLLLHKSESDAPVVIQDTSNPAFAGLVVPENISDPELAELREQVYQCEQSTLLYCCMAVEAYLNYYGVRKFGEKFYKRTLERSGITEKLSNIILAVSGECIEPDDEIYREVKELFESRNRLVHPKTREINETNVHDHVVDPDTFDDVEAYVTRMDRILRQFCSFDPEIVWDIEFGTDRYET